MGKLKAEWNEDELARLCMFAGLDLEISGFDRLTRRRKLKQQHKHHVDHIMFNRNGVRALNWYPNTGTTWVKHLGKGFAATMKDAVDAARSAADAIPEIF